MRSVVHRAHDQDRVAFAELPVPSRRLSWSNPWRVHVLPLAEMIGGNSEMAQASDQWIACVHDVARHVAPALLDQLALAVMDWALHVRLRGRGGPSGPVAWRQVIGPGRFSPGPPSGPRRLGGKLSGPGRFSPPGRPSGRLLCEASYRDQVALVDLLDLHVWRNVCIFAG